MKEPALKMLCKTIESTKNLEFTPLSKRAMENNAGNDAAYHWAKKKPTAAKAKVSNLELEVIRLQQERNKKSMSLEAA